MRFRPLFLALASAALLPLPAFGNALVHVKCSANCRVKIDGKRGEKVSNQEYLYDQIPAGIWEVEVTRGLQGGYAKIPAEGEVEILVSADTMLVDGQFALDKKAKMALDAANRDPAEEARKAEERKAEETRKAEERKAEKDRKEQERSAERERREQEKKAAEKAQSRKTKMAVVGLVARTGLDQATADLFSDALVGELRKRQGLLVTDRSDVTAVLGADREKQLLGCNDNSCMAEIGGALGVELLVRGTLGRVGKTLQVYLVLVDSKNATASSTVSEQIKSSSDEAFFEELPKLVDKLLKGRAAPK